MADTIHTLSSQMGKMLAGLRTLFEEISQTKSLINTLGWEAPPGLDDIGLGTIDFTSFIAKLQAILDSSKEELEDEILMAQRLAELSIALKEFIDTIFQLADTLPSKLSSLGDYADRTNIKDEFPKRMFNFWATTYLSGYSPPIFSIFHLINVVEFKHFEADPAIFQIDHVRPIIHFDAFESLLSDPAAHFKSVYGWGTPDFSDPDLLLRISLLLESLGLAVLLRPLDPRADELFSGLPAPTDDTRSLQLLITLYEELQNIAGLKLGFSIFGIRPTSDGAADGGLGFLPVIRGQATGEIPLFAFDDTFLSFNVEGETARRIALVMRPDQPLQVMKAVSLSEQVNGRFALGIRYGSLQADPKTILSFPGGFKLQMKMASLAGGMEKFTEKPAESFLEVGIAGGEAILSTSEADGFLQSSLSQKKISAPFDLKVGWTSSGGIYFQGSGGLELAIPAHVQLGPFNVQALFVALKLGNEGLNLEASAAGSLVLGPLTVTVDRIGLATTVSFARGNMGFFGLSASFKPPEGLGLSIDAGGIKGGGFLKFDPDKGEYFGAMELEFQDLFSMKALGIINTKMPDGSKGFSLLIIITAEFTPIQLGFGFTLHGVGGLLGMNRTVRIDVLKEGIKTNAIKSILFPEDVVANINRIVSDIKQVFPQQQEHFLLCPMGKLGWGTPSIITLELGLLIEIPVTRIAILGVLKALLPEESAPLLRLQVNFLGVIDFENKFISFDASLFDSRLLIYTLSGDMAFRLSFGDKPLFILTVGGFHPAFKEVPGDLQNLRRITLSLLSGNNPRITIQTYFAITSNTAQFGARAELYAEGGGFNIYGFVGYDVLFRFDPFQFIADFSAGLALRRKTSVVMGIRVEGQLSGPSPWDARGKASISFFFFSISVRFHETWGDRVDSGPSQKEDILALLTNEISDNRNWNAEIPANNKLHVSIKQIIQTAGKIAVHPFGVLTFSERLVPLEIDINKFGNKVPKDVNRFEIKTTDPSLATEPARKQFAPANFIEMKDEEKLSRPSFEEMKSGFRITGSATLQAPPTPVSKSVDYEFSYLGKKRSKLVFGGIYHYAKLFFRAGTKAAAVSNSSLSHVNNRISLNAPEPVAVQPEQFAIANLSDMKLHSKELVAGSYTEALQFYNELVKKQPALKDQVQIVSNYELTQN